MVEICSDVQFLNDKLLQMQNEMELYKAVNQKLEHDKRKLSKLVVQLQDELAYLLYEYLPSNLSAYNVIPILDPEIDDEKATASVKQYKLLQPLGDGATARIYEAVIDSSALSTSSLPLVHTTNTTTGGIGGTGTGTGTSSKKVAVKLIQKTKQLKLHYLKRQRNELLALKQLQHSDLVVQLMDQFQSLNYLFIVTERFGQNMRAWMPTMISEFQIYSISKQLCLAIWECHRHDIVHRDLKPENILIQEHNGRLSLKLCDFGMCEFKNRVTKICGTMGYMAPELILNECSDNGKMTDIWSLGCILLFLVKGPEWFDVNWVMSAYNFDLESSEEAVFEQFNTNLWHVLTTYIPKVQNELVQQCLKIDVEERPVIQTLLTNQFGVNPFELETLQLQIQQDDAKSPIVHSSRRLSASISSPISTDPGTPTAIANRRKLVRRLSSIK